MTKFRILLAASVIVGTLAGRVRAQNSGVLSAHEISSDTGTVIVDGLADKGGQVFNVKAYGAKGDGTTDDTAAISAAYNAAAATGGTLYFPPGTYVVSSGLTITKVIDIVGAGRTASVIKYTPSTGAALTLAYNSSPSGAAGGPVVCNINFVGPGSTTSTEAIVMGSDSGHTAVGVTLLNVGIGVVHDLTKGFGTAVQFSPGGWGYMDSIINPAFYDCGTGIDFYGENNSVFGGSISEMTTSIIVDSNGQATVTGTSLDSDTGPYVINTANFSMFGGRFETSTVALAAAGFIENSGIVDLHGGRLQVDLTSGTYPALITNNGTIATFINVMGTVAWHASGSAIDYIVTGPPSGTLSGVIAFNNLGQDSIVPEFDGVNPHQLTVIPSYNGRALQMYGYSKISSGRNTFTLPSSSGALALQGANGVSAGMITLASGTGSHTFTTAYFRAPVCTAADTTSVAAVKVTSTTKAISVAGTQSDVVGWICVPATN